MKVEGFPCYFMFTGIITCKPAEFLRRYPDIFVMTGGGNVGLREVLGPDAVSVPPPPPRVPKGMREDQTYTTEMLEGISMTDAVYQDLSLFLSLSFSLSLYIYVYVPSIYTPLCLSIYVYEYVSIYMRERY